MTFGKYRQSLFFFLDDDNDFEKQLVVDGFQNEIRKSIASFDSYDNEQHREAKESQRLAEIEQFSDDDLYTEITKKKTMFAPVALLVKVKASTFLLLRDNKTRIRSVSTRVLPLPALALTYKAPSSASTIDCCFSESITWLLMIPPQ
jgi:hypothetical protein